MWRVLRACSDVRGINDSVDTRCDVEIVVVGSGYAKKPKPPLLIPKIVKNPRDDMKRILIVYSAGGGRFQSFFTGRGGSRAVC